MALATARRRFVHALRSKPARFPPRDRPRPLGWSSARRRPRPGCPLPAIPRPAAPSKIARRAGAPQNTSVPQLAPAAPQPASGW